MITIRKEIQSEILMTTMEEIVPENSIFRKVDKYIDFTLYFFCQQSEKSFINKGL